MKFIVNPKTISHTAEHILKDILKYHLKNKATVVYLVGELGSGKTTLMQHIGKALGIKQKIKSPTFPIMKSYKLKDNIFSELIHIDAYRLEGKKETLIKHIKEKESVSQTIIFVEWPNLLPKRTLTPHATIRLSFKGKNTDSRLITYENKDKKRSK